MERRKAQMMSTAALRNVDLKRKTFILKDPKGKKDQILPLSNKALEILNSVPREFKTKWVFYGRAGRQRTTVQKEWEAIRAKAQLPKGFRFHGLRHHFASSLVSAGVSLYTVQNLLCHKDAATTQRYVTYEISYDCLMRKYLRINYWLILILIGGSIPVLNGIKS